MFGFLKYAVIAVVMASSASAATVFDEAVNGDAGDSAAPTALGILSAAETSSIFFTLSSGDAQDAFSFTTTTDFEIDALYQSVAFLYTIDTFSSGGCCGSIFHLTEGVAGLDPVPAGGHLLIVDFANFGPGPDSYQVDFRPVISAVPLPASALFLLSALAGLGFVRARKAA